MRIVQGAFGVIFCIGTLCLCPHVPRAEEPDTTEMEIIEDAQEAKEAAEAGEAGEAGEAKDAHHRGGDADHDPEELVVTGHPVAHARDELAVPVDRFDREKILDMLGATIGETLSTQPGISTTGFSGGASRPVIRGQDAFRTDVTEDGLSTQDVSRESPDHAVPINPLAIERLEVVRGPAALRYGGGAVAGVVNSITNRVPDELPDEPVTGAAFAALDSVADRRDIFTNLDGRAGPVGWHVDGMLREAQDYKIPTGGRQNGTFVDAFSGSLGASYFFGDSGRFGASYTRMETNYGIPEEDENAEIDMKTNRVTFEGDWIPPVEGIQELRLRGAYTNYEHNEQADGVVGQTFLNDQFDGRLEMVHEPFLGFFGAVGLTGRWRDFEAQGEAEEFLAPTTTGMFAAYLFEERGLVPGLVGEAGLRIEGVWLTGTPFESTQSVERSFVPISGSMALVYSPLDELNFGFTAAATQRAPDAVELFARGPHESTATFEIGNPDLDPETGYTAELRTAYETDRYRVEAAGFYTYYAGYIYGDLTGETVDATGTPVAPSDPDALDVLRYITRNAYFAGMELSGEADVFDAIGGTFGLDAQFDYVRARFTSGSDRNVPRIPPIRWGGNLFYRGDWVKARVGFLRTQGQDDVSDDENATDAFTFLNASVTLSLAELYDRVPVEFSIIGTNLTDSKGRNVVSFNADELLLPGRNVRGTVGVRF